MLIRYQIDNIGGIELYTDRRPETGRLIDREIYSGEYRPVHQYRDYIRKLA